MVTTTRPDALPMISRKLLPTSASEGLTPSRKILVESETSPKTPWRRSRQDVCVGWLAYSRRGIDFPIAGMKDHAKWRADGERRTLRDRMRHGDKFNSKGPIAIDRSLRDDGDWNFGAPGSARRFASRSAAPNRVA